MEKNFKGKKEFFQFINIAQGSLSELDTQIELSMMLNYISKDEYDGLMEEPRTISNMLFWLSKSLKQPFTFYLVGER